MTTIILRRNGSGGYATLDGRWTITPVMMGAGNNARGGWSRGVRQWRLTDTTGKVKFGPWSDRDSKIVTRLYAARDSISYHLRQEAS